MKHLGGVRIQLMWKRTAFATIRWYIALSRCHGRKCTLIYTSLLSLEIVVRGIALQKSLYRNIPLETMKVTDIGSFSGRSTRSLSSGAVYKRQSFCANVVSGVPFSNSSHFTIYPRRIPLSISALRLQHRLQVRSFLSTPRSFHLHHASR